MSSRRDRELLRRDAALPGLGLLLDPGAALAAIRTALPGAGVRSLRPRTLRYKPGRNCVADYTIETAGGLWTCHAKCFSAADAVKLLKALERPVAAGPLGPGRWVLAAQLVEFCLFPNDDKLPALARFHDPDQRAALLRRKFPTEPDLWTAPVRTLAYKPERRWTGLLDAGTGSRLVVKLHAETGFASVLDRTGGPVSAGGLRLPQGRGGASRWRARFFEWIPGRSLNEVWDAQDFDVASLASAGAALADLQQQHCPRLPAHPAVGDQLCGASGLLAALLPTQAGRVAALERRLVAALPPDASDRVTVHGDFHAKQVVLQQDGVALLDLDDVAVGSGWSDAAAFLGHLEREVLAGRLSRGRCDAFGDAFLDGYASGSGRRVPRGLLIAVAAALFARAPQFFRNCDPEWPRRTLEALDRIEALADLGGRIAPRSPATGDPRLPSLEAALSVTVAEARIAPLLSGLGMEGHPLRLRSATLRRHKEGRRALVEYDFVSEGPGASGESVGVLGKLRRRGVDAEVLRLTGQLHRAGWHGQSPDGFSTPEPLGAVEDWGMSLQRRVAGQSLGAALDPATGERLGTAAADLLVKLRHTPLQPSRSYSLEQEIAQLDGRLRDVATRHPDWQPRLERLLAWCHRDVSAMPRLPMCPVHRDLHPEQILVAPGRLWLVDLDLIALGDAALDAGSLAGHLLERAVRDPLARPACLDAARALQSRFLARSPGVPASALETWIRLTLVRHLELNERYPERLSCLEALLDACEVRCETPAFGASGTPSHPVPLP